MRNVSKSPIGQRIDIITQTIEEATKNISALKRVMKKQTSAIRLQIPKHIQQSKSTSSIGIQNTDRVRLNTQTTLQLNLKHDKSISKANTKRTDTSFEKRNNIEKSSMVTFKSFKNKIVKQLDVSKMNHNENLTLPSNNVSPISTINRTPRNLNFKSLSNFNFSSSCLQTPRSQKTIQMSPARVQLDVLEVPQHSGYHFIQYPKQNRSRQIILEDLKHKIAMKIRQRIQFNKLNPQTPRKHLTQNSCINLRDTLIRRVAASSGIIQ